MLIDLALIILLVTVITSIVFLINYIRKFNGNKNDFLKIIANLRILTVKAEQSMAHLSKLKSYEEQILNLITETESYVSELAIISQRAETLSNKLESNINSAKKIDITNKDSMDVQTYYGNKSKEESTRSFLDQSKYFNSLRKIESYNAT